MTWFKMRSAGTEGKRKTGLYRYATVFALAGTMALTGTMLASCGKAGREPVDSQDVNSVAVVTPEVLADDGRIHANIWISGVDVGGLTMDEARTKLLSELQKPFDASTIAFMDRDQEVQVRTFGDFAIRFDVDSAVQQAYDYTRVGNAEALASNAEALDTQTLELEAGCFFDTAAVSGTLAAIDEVVSKEVVEPKVQRENGAFVVADGQDGRKLDVALTLDEFTNALKEYRGVGGRLEVNLAVVEQPIAFRGEDLSTSMSLLGSWTTNVAGGDADRTTNVRLSAESVNNVYLLPGAIFSTNATFGETTAARGYRPGGAYVNGKLVSSIGGGICQTSSTLYRAVLEAELAVVERTNHSLPVGYMVLGFDATLSGNYLDMKFKNSTDYPILLETIMTNRQLTVNIYGRETRDPSRRVEYKSEHIETFAPPEEKVTEDPTLPLGERVVDVPAKTGYLYRVYKYVYVNDKFVEKVHVNDSRYRTVAAEVRVGTGAPAATEMPIPTPYPVDQMPVQPTPEPAEVTPEPVEPTQPPVVDSTPEPEQPYDPGSVTPDGDVPLMP